MVVLFMVVIAMSEQKNIPKNQKNCSLQNAETLDVELWI
jgi:hypothetical protein